MSVKLVKQIYSNSSYKPIYEQICLQIKGLTFSFGNIFTGLRVGTGHLISNAILVSYLVKNLKGSGK